jgi:hypothetical protein
MMLVALSTATSKKRRFIFRGVGEASVASLVPGCGESSAILFMFSSAIIVSI